MPIELKWVRQDPQQVQEWQELRLGERDVDARYLVKDVLHKDESSRRYLAQLQREKRRRNELLQKLRPRYDNYMDEGTFASPSGREELLTQKKEIDNEISHLEGLWKASLKEMERALNKLASPVDLIQDGIQFGQPFNFDISEEYAPSSLDAVPLNCDVSENYPPFSLVHTPGVVASSRQVIDLEQAFYRHTLQHFGRYSSWIELPTSGLAVNGKKSQGNKDKGTLSPDRAHALWGCLDCSSVNSFHHGLDAVDESHSITCDTSCLICRAEMSEMNVFLPPWMRLLVEHLPAKSIWGDKQLPLYTALWSKGTANCAWEVGRTQKNDSFWLGDTTNPEPIPKASSSSFSLQLVALAASSVVDARQLQLELLHELLDFYQSLLIPETRHGSSTVSSRLKVRRVLPCRLHPHEWSRLEILVERVVLSDDSSSSSQSRFSLGSVSHWGDAASRACDMAFAGGGGNGVATGASYTIKEYVHIVQASVVDLSTWSKVLHCNTRPVEQNGELRVGLPLAVASHLIGLVQRSQPEYVPSMVAADREAEMVVWLAWKDLATADMGVTRQNGKQTIFGSKAEQKSQPQLPIDVANTATPEINLVPSKKRTSEEPKFPPMTDLEMERDETIIWDEALSCPFYFLFQ